MIVLRKSTIGIGSVPRALRSSFKSMGLDTLNGIHDQYFNFCFFHSFRDLISCTAHESCAVCRNNFIHLPLTNLSN